eukprot:sb/3465247/
MLGLSVYLTATLQPPNHHLTTTPQVEEGNIEYKLKLVNPNPSNHLVEEGNIEYKLKLVNPNPSRLEHLVTQMKWRLREGQGEAVYEIGVKDNGQLAGLSRKEMDDSIKTLNSMATQADAECIVLKEFNINDVSCLADQPSSATLTPPLSTDGVPSSADEEDTSRPPPPVPMEAWTTEARYVCEVLIRRSQDEDSMVGLVCVYGALALRAERYVLYSQGEAVYEIGVKDNGQLAGLSRKEMDVSIKTLNSMATQADAECIVLKEFNINDVSCLADQPSSATLTPPLSTDGVPSSADEEDTSRPPPPVPMEAWTTEARYVCEVLIRRSQDEDSMVAWIIGIFRNQDGLVYGTTRDFWARLFDLFGLSYLGMIAGVSSSYRYAELALLKLPIIQPDYPGYPGLYIRPII